ncbi:MAG: 50S ribosomal protein L11 methyltransferase [Kiritimatiellae bacterium]|nr:50S ribosomal protein L11 methyltransferase [Kiritimatiellia bacterium]
MTCVYCSVDEQCVNPLFEVFEGGDFVLSSYRDVEDASTTMQIFFAEDGTDGGEMRAAAERALRAALDIVGISPEIRVRTFPDEDWTLSYRLHFKTTVISPQFAVVPAWERFEPSPGQKALRMDPGMAFGTGNHATTRACLEYIAETAPATSFLDVGCGSGILAVAAKLLGCNDVRGFDLDADAVRVAGETAAANGVEIPFFRGDLSGIMPGNPEIPPADFVAANVLGPVLIRFAERIACLVKPGGRIILSGILDELYPEVKAAYEALGFSEASSKLIGEWRTGLFSN